MFKEVYKNKTVLVTGHTGFKGSWLTKWLLDLGAEVIGYSVDIPTEPSHFAELNIQNNIHHYIGDVRDFKRLHEVFEKHRPQFVFHLAAQALVRQSYQQPRETFEINAIGTLNVLEAIRLGQDFITAGVFITSDKCYDNVEWVFGYRENDRLGGEDPYSGSKGCAELVAKSYMRSFFREGKPGLATARAGNVIGGGDWAKDRIVPDIARAWSKGDKVNIRSPYATRPWQHVLEPLSGYLALGAELASDQSPVSNEAFNFGPDSKITKTVGELLDELQNNWANSPGWNNVAPDNEKRESTLLKLCCDKANIELKWFPTLDFEETIRFTSVWYQNFYSKKEPVAKFTSNQIKDYVQKAHERGIAWAGSGKN